MAKENAAVADCDGPVQTLRDRASGGSVWRWVGHSGRRDYNWSVPARI